MRITRTLSLLAVLLLVTSLLPAATAQNRDDVGYFTGTAGVGANDVRDEPQFATEDNGFPSTDFSPQSETLILEAVLQYGQYFVHADTNNLVNRVTHGNDYGSWESYILPGNNIWQAYWGWWTDTGSGMELQEQGVPSTPNGAIDDADDDRDVAWDEFVWKGPNNAAELHGQCLEDETVDDGDDTYAYSECASDDMFAFVQPGTHDIHANCLGLQSCVLGNHSDEAGAPDFAMEWDETTDDEEEEWRNENGFGRIHYDQSLLLAAIVTISVDPTDAGPGLYNPEDAEAFDKDAYGAVHPALSTLYRTAVYDPGDQVDGPTDGIHEEGVKQFAKEDPAQTLETYHRPANELYRGSLGPFFDEVNPVRGLADDQYSPNFPHEPNTGGDVYGIDAGGILQDWATYDASTSYGGEPYYDPGDQQTYAYDTEEHFWGDSFATHDSSVNAVKFRLYGGSNYGSPGVDDAGSEMGSHSMLPASGLYLAANVGTWFDRNADTWIGNVSDKRNLLPVTEDPATADTTRSTEDDPYAGGLIDDPNDYGHTQDDSPDSEEAEWRGTCSADLLWTVEPTFDPDGDGEGNWGATGVYVYESSFNPYTPIVEDATGGAGASVTKPARDANGDLAVILPGPDDDNVQGANQGDAMSRYVTEGPIEITGICSSVEAGSGNWDPNQVILFPTGNVDYEVKITFEATLTDTERTAVDDAGNGGNSLTGESIVDVDYLEPSVAST